ncbi:MAG: hypothetical protein COB85_09870 [Bacteroidetes bacterium]|nr:MAG: hypothetical protein COB85_09870 [Bacteroidota bacterium]
MKHKLLFLLLIISVLGADTSAQVLINEYSASNLNQFLDNNGKTEDWIELYNPTGLTVNLAGMFLSDKPGKPTKWQIPVGIFVAAGGFARFWCSGRDTIIGNDYHTNFKLSQTTGKDWVVLTYSSGIISEQLPLTMTLVENSNARSQDGSPTWMTCTSPTPGSSNNAAPMFNGYAVDASMSLIGGFYSGTQTVTIQTFEPNAAIYYTTDGTAPTNTSTPYTTALSVSSTQIVKARVYSNDPLVLPGRVESNTYFIDDTFSLAVISIGADSLLELANDANDGVEIPIGSIEYFDINGVRVASSYGDLNRHGQDSWVLDQRSLDWVSRDEMGHNKAVNAQLFHYSTRNQYQRFMMRASGDDNYPSLEAPSNTPDFDHVGATHIRDEYVHTLALEGGMKLDVRAVERIIVYLNGQYWGVYGLRERPVDHDYIKEYYKQGKYDIQFLSTWDATEAEYGGQQAFDDWAVLRDFIMNNDMSIPGSYQVVKDNIQVKGLCDYFITNLNSVAKDWLNYNTGWWRGLDSLGNHKKWGYIVWDMDATWDYYINYTNIPNSSPTAEPCDIDDISNYMDQFFGTGWWQNENIGKHEKIFLKLQAESSEFQQLYYSRQADLMNTVYTCDNMLNTIDSMVATIAPEMPRHIARWGGSMTEWNSNVSTLRSFIEQRCTLLDDGMVNCFNLTGPYPLTVLVEPAGAGTIDFNTLTLTNFPWTGNYFGNMDNLLQAIPIGSNSFIEWQTTSGNVISPSTDSASARITLSQSDTLVAVFTPPVGIYNPENGFGFSSYPAIVNSHLNVQYELNEEMEVSLKLYSLYGVEVVNFSNINGQKESGNYEVRLSLNDDLAPGVYFLQFRADEKEETTKIVVTK